MIRGQGTRGVDVLAVRTRYEALSGSLSERSRRLWAALQARELGHGGIALVERATGISRSTIVRGIREVESWAHEDLPPERTRRSGGGRKRAIAKDKTLLEDLDALVEPVTPGEREGPLRWTSKSLRHLADELGAMGHDVSYALVGRLLKEGGYRLQANRKTREGLRPADRDQQWGYIARQAGEQLRRQEPVISVDIRRRERAGDSKDPGREWRLKGRGDPALVHDFVILDQGKAVPFGVFDLGRDEDWVSVGIDPDTASVTVNAIRSWWRHMGCQRYPEARSLLIAADAGGSDGPRTRLWKGELQRFANRNGLSITVCHIPPGTRKWNHVEHRLVSHVAADGPGDPLAGIATIVTLIGNRTTTSGLRMRCEIDPVSFPPGVTVSDDQMARLHLQPHAFHGEWNYTIRPAEEEPGGRTSRARSQEVRSRQGSAP